MKGYLYDSLLYYDEDAQIQILTRFAKRHIDYPSGKIIEIYEFHKDDNTTIFTELIKLIEECPIVVERSADAFWYLFNYLNFSYKNNFKIICAFFYIISILLIAIVIIQNVFYAISYMIGDNYLWLKF